MMQKKKRRLTRKRKEKIYTGMLILMCILKANRVSTAQEEVTLNVMIRYDFQIPEDASLIFEKADQMVWEKTGVHIHFIPVLPITQAEEKMMAEKEGIVIDIASKIAGEFEYQEMDELIELYGQDILKQVSEEEIQNTKQNGHLYTLPSKADCAASAGIAFRKDILEKYEIDPERIHTLQDVDQLFSFISKQEQDLIMTSPLWTQDGFLLRYRFYDSIPNSIFDFSWEKEGEVVNFYDTDSYREWIGIIRRWHELGYMPEELPLQNIKGSEMVKAGKLFSYFCACKPGIEWEESVSSGREMVIVPLLEPYVTNSSVRISPWGITKECEHPEEAMKFLNLLYSDEKLVNLLIYGIEDLHYTVLDDGTIDFPEGMTFDMSGYYPNMGWSFPNQMISYIWHGNDPDLWKNTEEFQKNARIAETVGFYFDDTNVREQNEKLNAIAEQYRYGLETGMLDDTIYLSKMLSEMEKAGAEEVKREIERQYKEWKRVKRDEFVDCR